MDEPGKAARGLRLIHERRHEAGDAAPDDPWELGGEVYGEAVVVKLPSERSAGSGLEVGSRRPELRDRGAGAIGRSEHDGSRAVGKDRLRDEGAHRNLLAPVEGAELDAYEQNASPGLKRRAPRYAKAVEGAGAAHEGYERALDVRPETEPSDKLHVGARKKDPGAGHDHEVGDPLRGDSRALEGALARRCRE